MKKKMNRLRTAALVAASFASLFAFCGAGWAQRPEPQQQPQVLQQQQPLQLSKPHTFKPNKQSHG